MKKNNALIGYTGFIGSNLLKDKKFSFSFKFNSKNIEKIKNKNFNDVVCTATYSKIWVANRKPKKDKKNIINLINNLKKIKVNNFILISTIEVFGKNNNKNENNKIILNKYNSAYCNNRIYLENFVKRKFRNYLIIRLPIVYGQNFVKNCIFDLLNNNEIEKLNGDDVVQIFNVDNLKKYIQLAIKKKIKVVNICPKPIKLFEISQKIFNKKLEKKIHPRIMNMKTIHKDFKISKNQTLKELKKFCERY